MIRITDILDKVGKYATPADLELIEKAPERKELEGMTLEQIQERFKQTQDMMDTAKMQDDNLETGG